MIALPEWSVVAPERRAHIERVAGLAAEWMTVWRASKAERARVLRAVTLHDALRDAPLEMLRNLTTASWDSPELLHGPAAAERARREGERDASVLDAVRYHSVGWADWDKVGHVLYLADYLEPGRPFDRERRAAWAAAVPRNLRVVLREVVRARMEWARLKGWPLMGETEDFWNALAAGA